MKRYKILLVLAITQILGCGGGSPSISVQPSVENFSESSPLDIQLDILWVVDPSRSMFEETENVKANISNFMEGIFNAGYDYRVGVISTAAWSDLAYQANNAGLSFLVDSGSRPVFNRLHNGECNNFSASQSNANTFLSRLNAPDLSFFLQEFDTYFDIYGAGLGTSGCGLVGPPFGTYQSVSNNIFADARFNMSERSVLGEYLNDERPLQSLEAFLGSSEGSGFVRDNAFLAVVMITDEADGSRDSLTPSPSFDPSDPGLHQAERYVNILNQVKGDTNSYSVYSIIKQDGSNPLGENIANLTGGDTVDIDGSSADYAAGLASIQQSIIEESSLYLFNSEPIVETIQVTLIKQSTGEVIDVQPDTGNGQGGFVYVAGVNGIKFIPPIVVENGDNLSVIYDRPSLSNSGPTSPPAFQLSNNAVSESATNGFVVGQLSIVNASEVTGLSYTLNTDSSLGGFSVSSTGEITVADSSLLDRETQPLHNLNVTATGSANFELTNDILIILSDAVDAIPVAINDQYTISEASANGSGLITVTGNVLSNDQGIDSAESHTLQILASPPEGSGILSDSGVFTYTVNRAELGLSSGQQALLDFDYQITDATGNVSSSAQIRVVVQGLNEPPVNDVVISDVNLVVSGGGPIPINLVGVVGESSGFSSGDLDDATDSNSGTGLVTTSGLNGAHFVTYDMEDLGTAGSELYQVTSVTVEGAHSMGNTVIQVLSEQDQVLSREVLSISESSTPGQIDFSTQVIGKTIKVIRSSGAVNSDLDDDIQLNEITVNGVLADIVRIDLNDHFTDPDDPLNPAAINYFATDINGEGPAPGWAYIVGTELVMVPPAGTNTTIGIVAEDNSGATEFVTFDVTRTGGSSINSAPIALLSIDDTQRGGITLERFGGGTPGSGGPGNCGSDSDQFITWDEGDDFIDQLLDDSGNLIYPGAGQFDHLLSGAGGTDGHGTAEDGWNPVASFTDNKYSDGGRILPFQDAQRCYGETYTGYFVPARTGLYRFRTNSLDDIVRLLVSPNEYPSDLVNVITGTIDTGSMRSVTAESTNSGAFFLGLSAQVDGPANEFFPGTIGNAYGSGHDTSIFFNGGIVGYQPGYTYLLEGNVYAFQIRFMEGGGSRRFDFEFDYREDGGPSGSWEDNWSPIDGVVSVPFAGSQAHSPLVITSTPFVAFNSNEIFYDAELDVLEYSVKMVNADGSDYLGPGGTTSVSEIGLSFNTATGLLSGSLNSVYTSASNKPRLKFTATERFTPGQQSVDSLVIKFD